MYLKCKTERKEEKASMKQTEWIEWAKPVIIFKMRNNTKEISGRSKAHENSSVYWLFDFVWLKTFQISDLKSSHFRFDATECGIILDFFVCTQNREKYSLELLPPWIPYFQSPFFKVVNFKHSIDIDFVSSYRRCFIVMSLSGTIFHSIALCNRSHQQKHRWINYSMMIVQYD